MATTGNWVKEAVSPYRLAGILSAALNEALETDEFEIAPQQVYGAVRSGSLEVGRFDSGHMKVNPSAANTFIQARIDRQLNKGAEDETETEKEEAEATA